MTHKFTLQPYRGVSSRYTCPECNCSRKTFSRYICTETGEHLAPHVGKCARIDNCGYHYKPRQYFKANPGAYKAGNYTTETMKYHPNFFNTIPLATVQNTLRGYHKNVFTQFLTRMFGNQASAMLINKYQIGSAKHWPGATVFWQIDVRGNTRTGKLMLYDKSCNRVKQPYNHIAWAHRLMNKPGFELRQCFFGEHLLPLEPFKMVAITESEKTAVMASVYHPDYIWLAAGSMDGLTVDKCKVLTGRTVKLFPDINGYAKWHNRAHELNHRYPTSTFTVDPGLFRTATLTDLQRGTDIADKWVDEFLKGEQSCVSSVRMF